MATRLLRHLHGALSLDLRHRDYPIEAEEFYWAAFGHCYIATEAMYHLWGRRNGYVPYVYRHRNGTHWWLHNAATGAIVDQTEPQLDGKLFPYNQGRRQNFQQPSPSRRARELMDRMKRADRKMKKALGVRK